MARQEAAERGGAGAGHGGACHRQPAARQRIAKTVGAVEENAGARILSKVLRVQRQAGDQEDGRPGGVGCEEDKRGVWMPGVAVQRGERPLERSAHEAARGAGGVVRGGRSSVRNLVGRHWISPAISGVSVVELGEWEHNRPLPGAFATICARRSHKAAATWAGSRVAGA